MNNSLAMTQDKKKYTSKKRRIDDQNIRQHNKEKFTEELDELKNKRPKGACQYVNTRNIRCRKQGIDQHDNGYLYWDGCLNKVLREERGYRILR